MVSLAYNAIHRTIQVVGDAWSLRILREMFRGARRFREFTQRLGISKAVLSSRLDRLVEQGVLRRVAEEGRHPEYRLTESGLDSWSLMLAMWLWETEWDSGPAGSLRGVDLPRARLMHTRCGHAMRPQLRCHHCHRGVLFHDTEAVENHPTVQARNSDAAEGLTRSAFRRAPRSLHDRQDAGVAGTLPRVIGDRWNSALIAEAFAGTSSFSEFERVLQVPPSLLTQRLGELMQVRVLQRDVGVRGSYELTPSGVALYPIFLELMRWGERWLGGGKVSPMRHRPCGHRLKAVWCCGECGEEISRAELRFDADASNGAHRKV